MKLQTRILLLLLISIGPLNGFAFRAVDDASALAYLRPYMCHFGHQKANLRSVLASELPIREKNISIHYGDEPFEYWGKNISFRDLAQTFGNVAGFTMVVPPCASARMIEIPAPGVKTVDGLKAEFFKRLDEFGWIAVRVTGYLWIMDRCDSGCR